MKTRFAFCLALFISASFTGCDHSSSTQAQQGSSPTQTVNVVPVEARVLNTTMNLPGQILAYESVDVFPKVTGFIEDIRVDRGSRVKKGELIIKLSAPELVAQRAQAEAAIQAAQSRLVSAQAKLTSDEGTYQHLTGASKTPGVVAENDLLVAQQAAAADRAQVQAAQNNVAAARETLRSVSQLESYLNIRAPFDGIVTTRNLHPGALVGPSSGPAGNQPIVHIESVGRLRLVVPVPEQYVAAMAAKQLVDFTVPAFAGEVFHAPVARISQQVDATTRTMPVELDVHSAQIANGSFANVKWPIKDTNPTLFVPTAAVTNNLQRTFVIRVRDGKADWVDVKTGVTDNGRTQVFGDLKAGDEVIARATDELASGTSVVAHQVQGGS